MQGFINEMLYESRWEAIWVQSSLASNVLYTGKQLCRSVQIGINLRSLPYADKEKVLFAWNYVLRDSSWLFLALCV